MTRLPMVTYCESLNVQKENKDAICCKSFFLFLYLQKWIT